MRPPVHEDRLAPVENLLAGLPRQHHPVRRLVRHPSPAAWARGPAAVDDHLGQSRHPVVVHQFRTDVRPLQRQPPLEGVVVEHEVSALEPVGAACHEGGSGTLGADDSVVEPIGKLVRPAAVGGPPAAPGVRVDRQHAGSPDEKSMGERAPGRPETDHGDVGTAHVASPGAGSGTRIVPPIAVAALRQVASRSRPEKTS